MTDCLHCDVISADFKNLWFLLKTQERRSINRKGNGRGKVGSIMVIAGYIPPSLEGCPRSCDKIK